MNSLLFLLALLGFTGKQARKPTRFLVGAPPARVISGEVWVIANCWGTYPGVLVGTIRDGQIYAREGIQYPRYWDQAFDYRVLVAVSNEPASTSAATFEGDAYGFANERPAYLHPFPDIYLSPPLARQRLGKNWRDALEKMGQATGDVLVLPAPLRRTIRFNYPDGRPLAGVQVYISLYGSNENHCGVPVGIQLGGFKTDSDGEISFTATSSAVAISKGYFETKSGGPAGTMFTWQSYLIVDGGQHAFVKQLWELPEYEYTLSLLASDNRPIAHVRLTGCDNFDGCGTGCGPVRAPESDERGVLRFRGSDLREQRSLTLVNAAGQERALTDSEMNQLLITHHIHLVW